MQDLLNGVEDDEEEADANKKKKEEKSTPAVSSSTKADNAADKPSKTQAEKKRDSETALDGMLEELEQKGPKKGTANNLEGPALETKSDTQRINELDLSDIAYLENEIKTEAEAVPTQIAATEPIKTASFESDKKSNAIKIVDRSWAPVEVMTTGPMKNASVADTKEGQNTIDEAVITLLHPDFFNLERMARRELLRKHEPRIRNWPVNTIDEKIIRVADCISHIDRLPMVDMAVLDQFDEPDLAKEFYLRRIELEEVQEIPRKYFEQEQVREDSKTSRGTTIGDYFASETSDALGAIGGFSGKTFDALTSLSKSNYLKFFFFFGSQDRGEKGLVCAGCGLEIKFKKKNREKDCFMAYKCDKIDKTFLFHDFLCVKLRKMKEAIRFYVFRAEVTDSTMLDPESLRAAFIGIDVDANMQKNPRVKPQYFTTPRRGDHNYSSTEKEDEEEEDPEEKERLEREKEKARRRRSKHRSTVTLRSTITEDASAAEQKVTIRHEAFRRYRSHVTMILERIDDKRRVGDDETYSDRFEDLPKVVLYCDLNEFGVSLWEFVSDALKSKFREPLWRVLEFLALEMGTNKVLDLLKRHTHLMAKHTLEQFDRVAKATIEGSKYPIASSLRLAAFMNQRALDDLSNQEAFIDIGQSYENVAKKLLKEIESDHLFALLILIPTDIDLQSVMELALQYELINFLEEPRIVRVSNAIWSGGLDFLRPEVSFQESEMDLKTLYYKLWNFSGNFYFSPVGKFATSSTLYLLYLALFSFVTWMLTYDYTPEKTGPELVLWVASAGYVVNEILEFWVSPSEYFSSVSNYWDVFIAFNWMILFYLRFINHHTLIRDSNGNLDETQCRNQGTTKAYMLFWAIQSVLFWSRVVKILQISRGAGPLIRMVMNMLNDVANFGLISILFLVGIAFAVYYIIGKDLQSDESIRLGTLSSVTLYVFQTILGQQDWGSVNSLKDKTTREYVFDPNRSNLVLFIIFFFSVFGTILLINLLIAMMANTFESVKEKSNSQLNKQRIETTIELDHSRAVAPPPLNVFAGLFFACWIALEFVVWLLTFGYRQFNEDSVSPLNKEPYQYNESDEVVFMKGKEKIKGKVTVRRKCFDRIKGKKKLKNDGQQYATKTNNIEADITEEWDCIVVSSSKTVYHVFDNEIIKVNKPLFKRRSTKIPSLLEENQFCRYCRYNLTEDRMHIEYYLQLFDERGMHVDPVDKQYMRDLLASTDRFGLPTPHLCEMCPNCYRPFKVENNEPDTINRLLYIFEVVSYIAFKLVVWPTLLILLFLPANIARLVDFISSKFVAEVSEEKKQQMSSMFRTEGNNEYRGKVREASKEDEEVTEVVRRIDGNVQKLETALLGQKNKPGEAKEDPSMEISLERDEFDVRIDKMRAEMNRKFEEIADVLAVILRKQRQLAEKAQS
ncbi:hypothetical protein RFI_10438 [Reticulomyxa filosa]|uniref:Ion transport domain-containing protein n=1 Tax=Reticulomyxa filosa TaxID=46433 RepID=X6NL19_RETFI|nr:hypothetical protein RFI_10438 [Reticulomyxa filosa]|eukprot:ETO26696.1 hypothetical protein RFI_10438 [Reticulomyxa filosa]